MKLWQWTKFYNLIILKNWTIWQKSFKIRSTLILRQIHWKISKVRKKRKKSQNSKKLKLSIKNRKQNPNNQNLKKYSHYLKQKNPNKTNPKKCHLNWPNGLTRETTLKNMKKRLKRSQNRKVRIFSSKQNLKLSNHWFKKSKKLRKSR